MIAGGTRNLLILLAAVAAMATACSHLDVQTFQNPDVTIPAAATYGWRSAPLGKERPAELDPRVHNALVHERIREAMEGGLLITLYERKTGKIAYRALGRDDNVRKRDASERAISNTVTRLLHSTTAAIRRSRFAGEDHG